MPSSPSLGARLADLQLAVRYAFSRPHLLVVLGMHRSGTSCVTRTLNLLGASFGRTVVDRRAPDNDEVHWESSVTVWINDEILARSGGDWLDPPGELRPRRRDYWRCRRFLWEFAGCRLATFKDPRLVLTYPVWKRVLPGHTLITCLRHPMNVARSLEERDGLPLERGLELWREYNRRLLEYSEGPVPVLWFDFDEGSDAVRRLVEQVSGRFGLVPSREALDHYDPDSHHHWEDSDLPADVADLYAILRRKAVGDRPA